MESFHEPSKSDIEDSRAIVVGPVPSVPQALALIASVSLLDGAILDVNLGGEPALPVADALIEDGVPLILTTDYDASALAERYASIERCEKPRV